MFARFLGAPKALFSSLLDIVHNEINALARNTKGLGRI